jgi:hypothetical protein
MCNIDIDSTQPSNNEVGAPIAYQATGAYISEPMDVSTVTESTFRVRGAQTGLYPTQNVTYMSAGDGSYLAYWAPADLLVTHAGEIATATLTRDIQCESGNFFDYGYSWQFTNEVDPESPGEFTEPVDTIAVGNGVRSICTADFDGDGVLDLATACYGSDSMVISLGSGNGRFMDITLRRFSGDQAAAVTAADFDGDGDMDIAVANFGDNNVAIFENIDQTDISEATLWATGYGPKDICAADFDNDGDIDLATANQTGNNVTVLLNNGNATFVDATYFAVGLGVRSIGVGDFNEDGLIDVVVASKDTDDISLLLGSGDGSLTWSLNQLAGDQPFSIAVGDFNGDGHADVATSNVYEQTVSVLTGNGGGYLNTPVSYSVGIQPLGVTAGDFDGDEDLDLAVANYVSDNVSILINDGDGIFDSDVTYDTDSGAYALVAGDWDNDDDLDLAVANYLGDNVSILLNEEGPCCVVGGDLDGNGFVNIFDAVYLTNILTRDSTDYCFESADVIGDGYLNIADIERLVDYLFGGAPPPPDCGTPGSTGGGGSGGVTIHLNGGDDVAYIGRTNTFEIWIDNSTDLKGLSLGLEIDAACPTCTIAFNPTYDPEYGYLKKEGPATAYLSEFVDIVGPFNNGTLHPDTILIFAQSWLPQGGLPPGPSRLCYSLEFTVGASTPPTPDGLLFEPTFVSPGGTWTFISQTGTAPPSLQGDLVNSETSPVGQFGFDIVSPDLFTSFEVVANGDGPVRPPLPGALASAGFPTPGDADPGSDQQVGAGRWALHVGDDGGSSGGGTRGEYSAFIDRMVSWIGSIDNVAGNDWEMRFTYDPTFPGLGGSQACRYFADNAAVWVPFELWRIGACTPDDPSDDIRVTPLILEFADNGGYDLENWGTSSDGGANYEHSASTADDDPYTDLIYWVLPSDSTPGQSGYLADETAILAGTYDIEGPRCLARTVLINVDGGVAPPFNQDWPEAGTVFRIVTMKSTSCGCCEKRGDINHDGTTEPDIADLIYLVSYMFQNGPLPLCDEPYSPECPEHYFPETDVNNDGSCAPDIIDLVYLVNYMFQDGPPLIPCP